MTYNWGNIDALVEFAESNGMQVHGHTLIWQGSVPAWLEEFAGSDEEFEAIVRDYITAFVGRFRGRVNSWDVVNEGFEPRTGHLRDTVFRRRMGDDYMARMFQYAHAADPEALLFYNDYGAWYDDIKFDATLAMVDDLRSRGIAIHGIGLQMHVTHDKPDVEVIQGIVEKLTQRGLLVHFSEMEVRMNGDGALTEFTPDRSQEQRQRVKEIVEVFLALPPEYRYAITFWGLRDGDNFRVRSQGLLEWPLLFDDELNPKPAYQGFLEALQGG